MVTGPFSNYSLEGGSRTEKNPAQFWILARFCSNFAIYAKRMLHEL